MLTTNAAISEDADEDDAQHATGDVGDQHGELKVQGLPGVPGHELAAVFQHQVGDQGRKPMKEDSAEVDQRRPQLLVGRAQLRGGRCVVHGRWRRRLGHSRIEAESRARRPGSPWSML